MKLNTPLKYFPGNSNDENYKENYNNSLLMARGDVICQYSAEDIPEIWVDFKDITDTSLYKWIRISFDGGINWPLQSKLNSNVVLEFSFEINNENILDYSNNTDFVKRYIYEIDNLDNFEAIKNNPTSIYVIDGKNSFSVIAPIVYREENNSYYLDILFTDYFITQQLNKTCIVKVLNNTNTRRICYSNTCIF